MPRQTKATFVRTIENSLGLEIFICRETGLKYELDFSQARYDFYIVFLGFYDYTLPFYSRKLAVEAIETIANRDILLINNVRYELASEPEIG